MSVLFYRRLLAVAVVSTNLLVRPVFAQKAGAAAATMAARQDALKKLVAEEWESELVSSPVSATFYGDYRYNDQLGDNSLAAMKKRNKDQRRFLARFEALDVSGLPEQEQLDRTLMVLDLKDGLESYRLREYEMPVNQMSGIHLGLAEIVASLPFHTTKQYEDYLSRLRQMPGALDKTITACEAGKAEKLMPPKYLLEKVPAQARAIGIQEGEASVFAEPLKRFPAEVPAADQARLKAAILEVINTQVRPAYMKFANYVEKSYAPAGRMEPGLWALPQGEERYRFAIHSNTTTEMEPDAIFQLGLLEIARIEAEQTAIAQKLGSKDLRSFRESLKTDPKMFATSRQDILAQYRKYIAQMQPKLPELFGLLPKAAVEVVPVETFREKEAPAAEYMPGTPDGKRPGRVYVNTSDFSHRSLLTVESTAYHEGVPGHHMQNSIAQELPSLPPFRQHEFYAAYGEGWALYSERLGKDIGFYQDPYSDFGRLNDELLRACRLVLDTGVHSKHWTRQQMVDFFHAHSGEDEPSVQAETDRYVAWPAQALAYKLGQLKILDLRERARAQLGAKYEVQAFHDEILNGGALPLDTLDKRVQGWIDRQKSGKYESDGFGRSKGNSSEPGSGIR